MGQWIFGGEPLVAGASGQPCLVALPAAVRRSHPRPCLKVRPTRSISAGLSRAWTQARAGKAFDLGKGRSEIGRDWYRCGSS